MTACVWLLAANGIAWAGAWHTEGTCLPDSVAGAISASWRVDVYKFRSGDAVSEDEPCVRKRQRISGGFEIEPFFRMGGGGGCLASIVAPVIANSISDTLRCEMGSRWSYECRWSTLCADIPLYGVRFMSASDTTVVIISDSCRSASVFDTRGNFLGGGELGSYRSKKWAELLAATIPE